MFKILQYSFFDLIRSRWSLLYLLFYLLITSALLFLSQDPAQVIISLLNVILILSPLIATMFGVMYYYQSREFVELLLAQPIPRRAIFWGQYLGLAGSLALSIVLGIGIPFLLFGVLDTAQWSQFLVLLLNGVVLSFIFSGLAYLIAMRNEQKIRGFGLAVLMWLFFAVIYDGLLLIALMYFREYPIEKLAIGGSLLNPIDLARTQVLLELDISALMGYTGAVFQKFLGNQTGMLITGLVLLLWLSWPAWRILRLAGRKDF